MKIKSNDKEEKKIKVTKKDVFLEKNRLFNKKISESKKKIKEEKIKIKLEKKNIRKNKRDKFNNSKIGKLLKKLISFLRLDKDNYSFCEVFVITLISLLVGAFSCFSVFIVLTGGKNYFVLSKDLDKFVEVYETISHNYYDNINKDDLINSAIDAMVSSVGDVYTSYVDPSDTALFNELVNGTYEGIGCTIQLQDVGVVVIEVFEDGPAFKAGLEVGDIIKRVDDKDVNEMSADGLADYIKNQSGAKIDMSVLRGDSEKQLQLIRGTVETPVVSSAVYEKNGKKIGYLGISIFSSVASKQFNTKLKELEKDGIDALVIDVRGNNGGYLVSVTDIVQELLPKGKIIYQIEKDGKRDAVKDKSHAKKNYPIAVLVDRGSASASEILAAAIKESYGGMVVGTKTYGKGTVQQTKQLSDGSMIKYTIENWLTPDGNWINEVGITPTYEIELDKEYYNNPIVDMDNQLQQALTLVSK